MRTTLRSITSASAGTPISETITSSATKTPSGRCWTYETPADADVIDLSVVRTAAGNQLRWTDSTTRARTFYRVYRASNANGFSDLICETRSAQQCDLRAETLVTTREQHYLDTDPPPDAIYRVGAAANWLDDETQGDVFVISQPVVPASAAP